LGFVIDREALRRLSGAEREQAELVLKELEAKRLADPLAFYEPHVKQRAFHSFTAQTKCFFGGNQSGKTWGGLADDIIQAVDKEALPEHLRGYKKFEPPFLCRIMAESFPVLETTLIEKLQNLVPDHQLLGGSWKSAYEKDLRVLHFQNGSKFFFMTYEQEVRKMGGASIDRVHFDEEPPLAVFNECRLRVMAHSGDLLFTMTPVFGLTWTFDQLWKQRGVETEKDVHRGVMEDPETGEAIGEIQTVTVDMADNPALSPADVAIALRGMSKEERAARKEGKFIALHGLIYGDFDKDRHRSPERPIPENVNVVVGIDPGIRHAAGVVWAYLTPDDTMVVFHEGYFRGMTAREVCEAIHETNEALDVHPMYYVIDPAARNQEHQTGRSTQMEYADNGIVTIAGQHAVTAGINRVRERFQTDRLFIQANCTHLIDELQKYRWKQPPRSGEETREAPVKKDDHLMDALRYAVMSRPYLPNAQQIRDETPLQRLMREDIESLSRPQPDQNIGQFGGVAA
jgi:phage terminase large subunit-like protein